MQINYIKHFDIVKAYIPTFQKKCKRSTEVKSHIHGHLEWIDMPITMDKLPTQMDIQFLSYHQKKVFDP